MRIRLAVLICAAGACLAAGPQWRNLSRGERFAGSWAITLTPNGVDASQPGATKFDEVLTFNVNVMTTQELAKHGFKEASYDSDERSFGPAKFNCTQTSDAEGKIEWQGLTSTGDDLQGTMTWTKKDGSVIHYDFSGNKKAS
jgi:hypothetical protein